MGYNTTILVLNDGLMDITRFPEEFVRGVQAHIGLGTEGDVRVGSHANAAHVMRTEHADVPRLYFTRGNSIIELSEYSRSTMEYINGPDYLRNFVINAIRQAESQLRDLKKVIRELDSGGTKA